MPDVIVEDLKVAKEERNGSRRIREEDLARHLKNENGDKDAAVKDSETKKRPSIDDDFQLREALNLLKGVNIVGRQNAG